MAEWTTEGVRAVFARASAARTNEMGAEGEFDRWLAAHDAEVRAQARVGALEDLMATAQERGHEHNVPMILIEECWHVMCTRAERGES